LKKYSILEDSLIFLVVYLVKNIIVNQLRMNFLPEDMIFAQTSSDASEASKYVDSGHRLRLRADSTCFKLLQDTFKKKASTDSAFICPTGN